MPRLGRLSTVNLVYIDVPNEVLPAARRIPQTTLLSGEALDDAHTRLSGYAANEAIAELKALGATVTIVKDEAAYQANIDELLRQVRERERPSG
jgi:hypothetical protein